MSQTDSTQIVLGGLLLLAGSAILFAVSGGVTPDIPKAVGILAAVGLAAGALLVGTSDPGRPV